MTRLIQIARNNVRRVALVEEPHLRLLDEFHSIYELAGWAISAGVKLSEAAQQRASRDRLGPDRLDYDPIYRGESDWRVLPPIDHPAEQARCIVSGTGLTHMGSARGRDAMHAVPTEQLTDSMKIFRWGVEGGRPTPGSIGTAPEWFYRSTGASVRAHGEPLDVPSYAEDGGEEAEVAGIYVIGPTGQPYRVGMTQGNEFSDHRFEKRNYLHLASSKLRTCALGPELVVDPKFDSLPVTISIEHDGSEILSKTFSTGEAEMCHSLENLEHHHFKFEAHRRPGDVHVHFFGTDYLSFSDGIRLDTGDVVQVAVESFGRPLRNPIRVAASDPILASVIALG